MSGQDAFVFITGRAGTGKSTLLRHFRDTHPAVPVLAPTGVAALNVEGETIHRFFRFSPGITPRAARRKGTKAYEDNPLYKKLDTIIVDEISMVRADLFDCMDGFLRGARRDKRPFGGVRIIAIGDMYQLPPVVTSQDREGFFSAYESAYFFSSGAFHDIREEATVSYIELDTVFRQTDEMFVGLLNGIRNRTINRQDLDKINLRVSYPVEDDETIILTTTNAASEEINQKRLRGLMTDEKIYIGRMKGSFSKFEVPTDTHLRLKIGARVMCMINDVSGRYVNGSLGVVRGFGDVFVTVELDSGDIVDVVEHDWTVYRSTYDANEGHLDQEKLGSYTQIPLRLAWAVTIHKSQGKTFDSVIIDLGHGAFAAGQVYVALSRCRRLEGVTLIKPVTVSQIHLDPKIGEFMENIKYPRSLF